MLLDGKYIIINKNNVKVIMNFLYSNGHKWNTERNYNMFEECVLCEYFNITYLYLNSVNLIEWVGDFPPFNREEITITQLLRESKLKYILE